MPGISRKLILGVAAAQEHCIFSVCFLAATHEGWSACYLFTIRNSGHVMVSADKRQGVSWTRKAVAKMLAALGGLVAFGPTVFAADMSAPVYKAPPPSALYSWTGFYVGGNVGYGWSNQAIALSGTGPIEIAQFTAGFLPTSVASDPNGFLGGVQAGYNYQSGRFVFGAETDIDYADIHRSVTVSLAPIPPVTYVTTGGQKLDWFGTLRARLGFLPSDRLLIYATGGLAYGHGNASTNSVVLLGGNACGFFAGCGAGASSGWLAGWTAGGGLEWAFANQWSVKGEYLYYDIGRLSYFYPDSQPIPGGYNASVNFRGNIVRVGLNYKFH